MHKVRIPKREFDLSKVGHFRKMRGGKWTYWKMVYP